MKREKLKHLREINGLTQSEMAEKCGCSRVTYCKTENGESDPHPRFWKKLKQGFNIPDNEMHSYQKGGNIENEKAPTY